ncbi:MAG: hypothetical protein AAGA53_15855 [Pseudomonadota bacterium]
MGYWEQIGEENRKHREQRARMHPLRLKITDFLEMVLIYGASIVLWVMLLTPIWLFFAQW